MSKKNRFFFLISIILIVVGFLCCVIGLIGGSRFDNVTNLVKTSSFSAFFYRNDNNDLDSDSKIWEETENSTIIPITQDFSKIALKIESVPVSIIAATENYLKINEMPKSTIKCKVKNGTLTISDSQQNFDYTDLLHRQQFNEHGFIELGLSKQDFKKFTITLVSGSVVLSDCSIHASELEVKNDYGLIHLEKIISDSSNIKNESGELTIIGKLNNKSTIYTNNGKINLELENAFSECNFVNAKNGLGSIFVNGNNLPQNKSTSKKPHSFNVSCTLGTVAITTN